MARRSDEELLLETSEKHAALTLRMARKADSRIKELEEARDSVLWLEAQDGFTESEADALHALYDATQRLIDARVQKFASRLASGQKKPGELAAQV